MRTLLMLKALGLAATAGVAGGMVLGALSLCAAGGARRVLCRAARRAESGDGAEAPDAAAR